MSLTIDGHALGPFVAVLPVDARGDVVVPAVGSRLAIAFRTHSQRNASVWATSTLKSTT